MPVLVSADIKGQTKEGYEGILAALKGYIIKAPGFVLHTSHETPDGWRVIEVWNSKREADEWYSRHVAPNLPPGINPKRSYQELRSFVSP
jgi:quinol monooxygenase YgiN